MQSGPGLPNYRCFTITLRHITLGRTPLDEWSVRSRDLYLTANKEKKHKRQISVRPAGFEPVIQASERPQTQVLDGAATGIGNWQTYILIMPWMKEKIRHWCVNIWDLNIQRNYCFRPISLTGVSGDFFLGYPRQNHVPWGRLSLWKWVPGIYPGVKSAGAFGWRPTTLVVPKRQENPGP